MAKIGLKYPIAAKIAQENPIGLPTYEPAFVVGKAIEANASVESTDAELWADDVLAESDTGFAGGTIDIGIDHLSDAIYAKLGGHEIVTENGVQVVRSKGSDIAPYVGFGYLRVLKKANVVSYRAMLLYKVQFSEPSDEGGTKNKNVEFSTDSLSGKIIQLPDGTWRDRATFANENDAKAWLEAKFGIVAVVSKTALATKIGVVQALVADDYTATSYGPLYMALQIAISVNANADASQAQVDAALADLAAKQNALVEIA